MLPKGGVGWYMTDQELLAKLRISQGFLVGALIGLRFHLDADGREALDRVLERARSHYGVSVTDDD